MADVSAEREGLMDGMPRDDRGYWQPEGLKLPNPVFDWPPNPLKIVKWVYNYLFPWNIIYMLIAVLTVVYLQPGDVQNDHFQRRLDRLYLRAQPDLADRSRQRLAPVALVTQVTGLPVQVHAGLAGEGQEAVSVRQPALRQHLLELCQRRHHLDAYEVVTLWAYANEYIPYLDPARHPVYFVLMLCGIQLWRLFHFYWVHRLLHWPPLYKAGHYLHHRNINIGPWSGLSMHPIEHILYFSGVLIHWIIPSHPIHAVFNGQHAALTPAQGHAGFEAIVVNGKSMLRGASYFHQLHHRYFECNYGEMDIPFDVWFGTSHNGSAEDHEAMRAKRFASHKIRTSAA